MGGARKDATARLIDELGRAVDVARWLLGHGSGGAGNALGNCGGAAAFGAATPGARWVEVYIVVARMMPTSSSRVEQ
jgi:hypothetical protein